MANVTDQAVCDKADVATTLAGLLGTVVTYCSHSVTRLPSGEFLVVVAYDEA